MLQIVLTWKVWTYVNYVDLPKGSKILGSTLHEGHPAISVMFPKDNYCITESRKFLVIGEGRSFDERVISYIGEVNTIYPTSMELRCEIAPEPIKHYIFEIN